MKLPARLRRNYQNYKNIRKSVKNLERFKLILSESCNLTLTTKTTKDFGANNLFLIQQKPKKRKKHNGMTQWLVMTLITYVMIHIFLF